MGTGQYHYLTRGLMSKFCLIPKYYVLWRYCTVIVVGGFRTALGRNVKKCLKQQSLKTVPLTYCTVVDVVGFRTALSRNVKGVRVKQGFLRSWGLLQTGHYFIRLFSSKCCLANFISKQNWAEDQPNQISNTSILAGDLYLPSKNIMR